MQWRISCDIRYTYVRPSLFFLLFAFRVDIYIFVLLQESQASGFLFFRIR